MSPSWRRRLVLGLAPRRLDVLRLERGWRPKVLDRRQIELGHAGQPAWTTAIEACERLLDDSGWQRHELHFILAGHFARLAVLPAGQPLGPAEQADLARLIFRNRFGELAHDWTLRVCPTGRAGPLVACGVPDGLLAALQTAAEGRGLLKSIQPGLMTIFNRIRRYIDAPDGILAIVEAERQTFARFAAGRWQDIASLAGRPADLPRLLAQQASLAGQPAGGRLWLCQAHDEAAAAPEATLATMGALHPSAGPATAERGLDIPQAARAEPVETLTPPSPALRQAQGELPAGHALKPAWQVIVLPGGGGNLAAWAAP